MAHQETDAVQEEDEARQVLAVGVIACLAFIGNCFENEDANLERVEREK